MTETTTPIAGSLATPGVPALAPAVNAAAARLDIDMTAPVWALLSGIGRTEDVRFSPDNRRLIISGFRRNCLLLLDIEITHGTARPNIKFTDAAELVSDALDHPHGFDFIGNDQLVVASRSGRIAAFDLPRPGQQGKQITLSPLTTIGRTGLFNTLQSPGSVAVLSADANEAEILVCNNYRNRVTRHTLGLNRKRLLPKGKVLLEHGLMLPDGIDISPDRRWIAVSNHVTRCVAIYDTGKPLDRNTAPAAHLFGARYPHGVRFSPDGKRLYSADAGAPFISVFEVKDGNWNGELDAVSRIRVLDDQTFLGGHYNPQEGGPKGIDLDKSGTILAVTCETSPLTLYYLPEIKTGG